MRRLSSPFAAELEALRLRHLQTGSLDVAQEIIDLLVGGAVDEDGGDYLAGYRAGVQDCKDALENL